MLEEEVETKVVEIKEDLQKEIIGLFDQLDLAKSISSPTIVVATGPTETKKFYEEVWKPDTKYKFEHFIVERADSSTVNRLVEICQKDDVVGILGIGGGKIDAAKYAAHIVHKSFFDLPTNLSSDWLASPKSVVKDGAEFFSINTTPPKIVFKYKPILLRCPPRHIAALYGDLSDKPNACADWLLRVFMEYKTGEKLKDEVYFDEVASTICVNALKDVSNVVKKMQKIYDETQIIFSHAHTLWPEIIDVAFNSAVTVGKAMSSLTPYSSRPASGPAHLCAHALDAKAPRPLIHGEGVGVMSIFTYNLRKKYADDYLVEKPFGVGLEDIVLPLRYMRAPTDAKELGVDDITMIDSVVYAAELGEKRWFNTFSYLKEFHKPPLIIDRRFAKDELKEAGLI